MNFDGVFAGFCALALIGLFHPIVIQCEYHLSERIWPVFLLIGLSCLLISLWTAGRASLLAGLLGTTSLWSIVELKAQRRRVEKGWFPRKEHQAQAPTKQEKEVQYQ